MSWYLVGLILTIHQLEEEMRALATYDALTGLLSRRVFLEQTDYFHNIAIRDGLEYSVIIVDLDNFKKINDQYGHAAGDKTLESFGKAVRNTFRESDLACRFGGDEFVFFLPNTSSKQAWYFSERLQAVIREAIEHDDLLIHYTASMGLVTFPEVIAKNIEEVIRAADKALYRAKTNGGNHTQVFNANRDR